MEPDDERALVAAAQRGDREALERLLRHHHDRIAAVCRRMTGQASDADDAVQEALIAIVRGLAKFDGRSRFSTWAYRIAVNTSLDELRRRRRRPEPGLPEDDPGRSDLGDGAWTSRAGGGPDVAAVADRLDIDAALRRLPAEFRAAVVLRDLCGLDYAEIAEALDVPVGTVRSRISRGRAALVPLLGPGNSATPSERQTGRP